MTFVTFSVIFAILGVIIMIYVPNEINKSDLKEMKTRYDVRYSFQSLELDQSQDQLSSTKISNVINSLIQDYKNNERIPTNRTLLRHREILFCLFATTMAAVMISFQQDILIQNFNARVYLCLPLLKKLLYYLVPLLTFIVGKIVAYGLTRIMQRKLIIFVSWFLAACSLFIAGPSYIFGLNDTERTLDEGSNYTIRMQLLGFGLTSFFTSFMVFCLLSELLCLAHSLEDALNDIQCIDRATGLFTMFTALGFVIAIIAGNLIVSYIKQGEGEEGEKIPLTCDIIAILSLVVCLAFFVTNKVFYEFCRVPRRDADPIFNKIAEEMLNQLPENEEQPEFGLDIALKNKGEERISKETESKNEDLHLSAE